MLSDHNVMELVGLFLKFGWTITNDQLFFPALIDQSQIQNKYTILV